MTSTILIPLLAAIAGGMISHLLTSIRDRTNKRRDKRIDYLVAAYRRLEFCANRAPSKHQRSATAEFDKLVGELESAVADIQLFGSAQQIALAQNLATEFAKNRSASLDNLLEDLRIDLRKELHLEGVSPKILHLRYTKD